VIRTFEERATLIANRGKVVTITLKGYIFFGSAVKILEDVKSHVSIVVPEMTPQELMQLQAQEQQALVAGAVAAGANNPATGTGDQEDTYATPVPVLPPTAHRAKAPSSSASYGSMGGRSNGGSGVIPDTIPEEGDNATENSPLLLAPIGSGKSQNSISRPFSHAGHPPSQFFSVSHEAAKR
jgi:hypothetical protein